MLWTAESCNPSGCSKARHGQRAGKLIQALLGRCSPRRIRLLSRRGSGGLGIRRTLPRRLRRLRAAIRPLDRRAPLALSRSATLSPDESGDALCRDASIAAMPHGRLHRCCCCRRSAICWTAVTRRPRLPPPRRATQRRTAGEVGSGKSAQLSYVGNLDHTARFHDVVYSKPPRRARTILSKRYISVLRRTAGRAAQRGRDAPQSCRQDRTAAAR